MGLKAASARDRTPEFLMVCERLQKQLGQASTSGQNGSTSLQKAPSNQQIPSQHSEFARRAAEIGHAIHKTSMKLQKLTQLAKRTSMFDDPTLEVEELTGLIKQDIASLQSAIADLQRISRGNKEDNKQSNDHSHTVVDSLGARLKETTQQFTDVLTMRSENLKHHKERRRMFTSDEADAALTPLLRPRHIAPGAAGDPEEGASSSSAVAMPTFMQTQSFAPAAQDALIASRALAIKNVESTIAELGSIFSKLSEMVANQEQLTIRIDSNIEDTLENVKGAQGQLLKYLNTISSNRWLVIKVFFVLLIFMVFFILFIA